MNAFRYYVYTPQGKCVFDSATKADASVWCNKGNYVVRKDLYGKLPDKIVDTSISDAELGVLGTALDLDKTEKAYSLGGVSKTWVDYSIPGATDPDNLWDQDAYYDDFDAWWLGLPFKEKLRIYCQIYKID